MRDICDLRGLRYPDVFVVRHFFKRGLDKRPGRALELGCASGANLMLYRSFGWEVTGVDYDSRALEDARHNLEGSGRWIEADLSLGPPRGLSGPYDVLLLPSVLYYIDEMRARALLSALAPQLSPGAEVYARMRLLDDYRYGRGVEEGPNAFRLTIGETGEQGLLVKLYSETEIVSLLSDTLGLSAEVALRCRFDNLQGGRITHNSDLIVWGARRPESAGHG